MSIKEQVQKIVDDLLTLEFDGFGTSSLDPNPRYRRFFRSYLRGSHFPEQLAIEVEFEERHKQQLREIVFEDIQYLPPHPRDVSEEANVRRRYLKHITRRLRAWVINSFVNFVASDTDASDRLDGVSVVNRHIIASATQEDLAKLTGALIDDALGLISDGITDDPSEDELESFETLRDQINQTYWKKYVEGIGAGPHLGFGDE